MKPSPSASLHWQLEKQLFEAICLILACVMSFLSVQSFLNLGLTVLLLADISMVVVGISFFYLSYSKGFFDEVRLPFIIMIYGACTLFWFWLNGLYGSSPYAMIAGCMVVLLLVNTFVRWILLVFSLILIIFLVVIQSETDWISDYAFSQEKLGNNFVIFSSAILIIIHYIKTQHDNERIKVWEENQKQVALNKQLEQAIQEKDLIIRQLRTTKDQLVESEKMASIGKLTAGLAHELNNPLNYIGGIVTPLTRDLSDLRSMIDPDKKKQAEAIYKEVNELLEALASGTRRASDVMRNLVRLSPYSSDLPEEELSITSLLEQTCNMMQSSHEEIRFTSELAGDLKVMGSAQELSQVFVQLLQNSVQSILGTDEPEINIQLAKDQNNAVISISDNGEGIASSDLSRIFEPFFTTKSSGEGAGLGLFLSYSIVKKHNGDIKIESKPTIGTTVSVFLPIAKTDS